MQNHSEEPIPARLGKCSVLSEFIRLKTQVFLKWRKELFLCIYRKHGALSNKSAIEETGAEKMGGVPFLIFFTEQKTIGTLVLFSVRGIKEIPSRREGGELKYESMVDKEKTDAIRDNSNQILGPLR